MRRPLSSKSDPCTEGAVVYATGLWTRVAARSTPQVATCGVNRRGTEPYARWSGRTGAARPPPPRCRGWARALIHHGQHPVRRAARCPAGPGNRPDSLGLPPMLSVVGGMHPPELSLLGPAGPGRRREWAAKFWRGAGLPRLWRLGLRSCMPERSGRSGSPSCTVLAPSLAERAFRLGPRARCSTRKNAGKAPIVRTFPGVLPAVNSRQASRAHSRWSRRRYA